MHKPVFETSYADRIRFVPEPVSLLEWVSLKGPVRIGCPPPRLRPRLAGGPCPEAAHGGRPQVPRLL
jgi:hypothetical protein